MNPYTILLYAIELNKHTLARFKEHTPKPFAIIQLSEHRSRVVVGSSLCSVMDTVSASQPRGRGFEPPRCNGYGVSIAAEGSCVRAYVV